MRSKCSPKLTMSHYVYSMPTYIKALCVWTSTVGNSSHTLEQTAWRECGLNAQLMEKDKGERYREKRENKFTKYAINYLLRAVVQWMNGKNSILANRMLHIIMTTYCLIRSGGTTKIIKLITTIWTFIIPFPIFFFLLTTRLVYVSGLSERQKKQKIIEKGDNVGAILSIYISVWHAKRCV